MKKDSESQPIKKKDEATPLSGLLKSVSQFKTVIRKVKIISEESERKIYRNDATIRAITEENNKRFEAFEAEMKDLSTEKKLDKALEVVFSNFAIINRSMETKSLLISDMNEYLKKTRNTMFSLLKSVEFLLEEQAGKVK